MSDKLGPVTFGKRDEQIFLGREMATHKNFSEATAVEIDGEIRGIVDNSYARVLQLLKDNIDILHRLSNALVEKENLSGEEVETIVTGVAPAVATVTGEIVDGEIVTGETAL